MFGGAILTLQQLLGHHDVKVTMKYAHLAPHSIALRGRQSNLRPRASRRRQLPADTRFAPASRGAYVLVVTKPGESAAVRYLTALRGGALTFGALLRSIRQADEHTVAGLAKRLGISRAHLSEVETGRRLVSAARAAGWARALGYPEALFVKLALQADLDAAGLKLRVDVSVA
jgi:plasmid maintenance system antidote protein VapI